MSQIETKQRQIEYILPQLRLEQLEMVLAFTEFVKERATARSEDEFLWSFVEQEQAYRAAHPGDVFVVDSEEKLLAALDADLSGFGKPERSLRCSAASLVISPPAP